MAIQQARKNLVDFEIATNPNYEPNWHHDLVGKELEHIEKYGDRDYKILIVVEPPRHGKLISHDTPILTISGWKNHGELQVGDFVFGREGLPKRVIWLSEEDFADNEISFSDGSSVQCHDLHEWVVFDRFKHEERKYDTRSIRGMKLECGPKFGRGHRYRLQLDSNVPLDLPERNLLIHPYMLGVWLGDGSTDKNCITYSEKDNIVIEKLTKIGYVPTTHNVHKTTGVFTDYIKRLYGELVFLGLKGNKHIPQDYLLSSLDQRKELLAGLIDTDGSVDKNGRVRIVTVMPNLAEEVKSLVLSLGMNAYITYQNPHLSTSGIQGKKRVYTVGFNCDIDLPITIPRKKTGLAKQVKRKRAIVSVKKIEPRLGRCIQVEGGIYLVGKTFVPTHNSQQISIDFPAWYLGRNPTKEIIAASYSAELAQDFGSKTREKVSSEEYQYIFPGVRLREDEKARGRWKTTEGGSYVAVGVGGPITGRGANILLIDDPVKNREEAESEVYREKTWNWFTSTAFTRLEPSGVVIIMITRWHMDDLVGRILANSELSERTKVILLPAIAAKDGKNRKQGEPLWEQKYPSKALEEIRKAIGPYDWSALYMGSPILTENQEFKPEWIHRISEEDVAMMNCRRFLTIDTAISKATQADYTGFCDNSVNRENFWHFRAWRTKISAEELVDSIFSLHESNKYERIGIEKTIYLQGLKPYLDEEQRKRGRFLPIVELTHNQTQKEVRIRGLIPRYAAGSIFHIKGRCEALEEEQMSFPVGVHDDVIDATAYQLQIIESGSGQLTTFKPSWSSYGKRSN